MQVQFLTEGGIAFFPGLSKPTTIDSADLSPEQADKLRALLESTNFFDLPAASRTLPKGAADYRRYTIAVADGRRRRTVRLIDPVETPDLQQLIVFLQDLCAQPVKVASTGDE